MVHATVIAILGPLAVFLWLHAPRLHTGGYTWITVLVVGFAAAALLFLAVTLATEPGIIPPLVYRIRYLTGRSRRFRDGDGAGSSRAAAEWEEDPVDPAFSKLARLVVDGRVDDARALLSEQGAHASRVRDAHGRTALHIAAHRGHLGALQLLLQRRFDPRECDVFDLSPLHYAALAFDDDACATLHRALRAAYGLPSPEGAGPLRDEIADDASPGAGTGQPARQQRQQQQPGRVQYVAADDLAAQHAAPEDRMRRVACMATHTAVLTARSEARRALSAREHMRAEERARLAGGAARQARVDGERRRREQQQQQLLGDEDAKAGGTGAAAAPGADVELGGGETGHAMAPRRRVGRVSGRTLKHCRTCMVDIEERGHHCSDTNACVHQFDHFCPWMGNVVGRRNHRYFVGFLVAASFLLLAAALGGIMVVTLEAADLRAADEAARGGGASSGSGSGAGAGSGAGSSQNGDPGILLRAMGNSAATISACALLVFLLCMGLPVVSLCVYHVYLLLGNSTTNEEMKGDFESGNPFSEGCFANLRARLLTSHPSEVAAPWAVGREGGESDEEIKTLV